MKSGTTRFLGIVLFVLIGASALVLGVMNAGNSIGQPMKIDTAATIGQADTSQADAALKAKDTDGDGLSDYDELNVYHTSPYIKDSDSDGIDDGTEVKNGTDPNCPKGQNCSVPAPLANTPDISVNTPLTAAPDANLPTGQLPVATMGNVAQIRQLLKDQGLSDDVLNSIDDQTLVNMYNESLPSAAANSNTNQ